MRAPNLYALAAVLYEMGTGQRAFPERESHRLIAAVLQQTPPAPSEVNRQISAGLESIILKALQKDPERRYQSARDLLADLKLLREPLISGPSPVVAVAQSFRKPQVAIPALLVLLALALAAGWWIHRTARVRWAKEEALPEIERLVETSWRDSTDLYKLAEKAEQYIPNDQQLSGLLSRLSLKISINTEPSGADVYMKEYKAPDSEWTYLGVSPIAQIRLPIGSFRWEIAKEGHETVIAASSTWDIQPGTRNPIIPSDLARALSPDFRFETPKLTLY